jgi:hypothetical protein
MAVAELGCARDRLSALNRLLAEAVATLPVITPLDADLELVSTLSYLQYRTD